MSRVSIQRAWRALPIAVTIVVLLAVAVSRASTRPTGLRVVVDQPAGYPEPEEEYYNEYFRDDFDGDSIDSSVWQVASWREHGGQTSPDRVYIEDGVLKMVFVNDETRGFLSSAMQTRDQFYYGTWRVRAKPSSVAGVLNSIYTIDWENRAQEGSTSDGTKQEVDIEFLTKSFARDSGEVHLAVHAAGKPSWDTRPDIRLDFDPSADFHVWGFEITPDHIRWFVDDITLMTYVYADRPITIDAPYMFKLNVWSDTGWWIGPPPAYGVESVYEIDWVEFTPYGK